MMIFKTNAGEIGYAALLATVALFLLSAISATASAQQLADVPVPFNTDLQVVASELAHNGHRVSMATYTSSLSLEESTDFYRRVWSGDSEARIPGMIEMMAGEWLLMSRLSNGYNTVIQLRLAEPHRSSGFVSIMPIPGFTPNKPISSPVEYADAPDGLQLLSTTQSNDGSRSSRLSVYSSLQSIQLTTRLYIKHLQDLGWTLVSEQSHAQNKVVLLNQQSGQLELVVSNDSYQGGSVIVVNEIVDHG